MRRGAASAGEVDVDFIWREAPQGGRSGPNFMRLDGCIFAENLDFKEDDSPQVLIAFNPSVEILNSHSHGGAALRTIEANLPVRQNSQFDRFPNRRAGEAGSDRALRNREPGGLDVGIHVILIAV